MFRTYDICGMLEAHKVFKKCQNAIIARKAEMNVLDLSYLINLYAKHGKIDDEKIL